MVLDWSEEFFSSNGDDTSNQKKQKTKWNTSYSNMAITQAEERLGFRIATVDKIPVEEMLEFIDQGEAPEGGEVMETKRKVYEQIVRYLRIEGEPTEADPDFKAGNINHLVFAIISPILEKFALTTGRNVVLGEKEIVSTDGETGGPDPAGHLPDPAGHLKIVS